MAKAIACALLLAAADTLWAQEEVAPADTLMPDTVGMAAPEALASPMADVELDAEERAALFAAHVAALDSAYLAELAALRERIYAQDGVEIATPDPAFYRLFGPPTYYRSAMDHVFSLDSVHEPLAEQLALFYAEHPERVRHYDWQWADMDAPGTSLPAPDAQDVREDIAEAMQTLVDDSSGDLHLDIEDIGLQVEKPNFWSTSASVSLQFTQNYFSDNWYKGGSNTQTMLAGFTVAANYNDEQKITWENKLTMKLGFVTSPSDTCHTLLTNNDKLNLYSKLGVQAHKNWYYAGSVEANTQFMPGYYANNPARYSAFLAPLDVYVSIGMDYKPTLSNGNSLSVALLPLSYKLRYIGSADENIHSNYSMVGKDAQHDFGCKVELSSSMTLATNLTWKLRAYFYTAYDYVEAELENTFKYAFNKYLSAELYTLWRFDDSRSRAYYDSTLGYFQFKEYFTFGLSYSL